MHHAGLTRPPCALGTLHVSLVLAAVVIGVVSVAMSLIGLGLGTSVVMATIAASSFNQHARVSAFVSDMRNMFPKRIS
jgi:hypothetical protein